MEDTPVIAITLMKRVWIHGESLLTMLEQLEDVPEFDEGSPEYKVCIQLIKNILHDYEMDAYGFPVQSEVKRL